MPAGMIRGAMLVLLGAATAGTSSAATFGGDLDFLRAHMDVRVLSSADGQAQVAVTPGMQGRIMTTTATGLDGLSFGWINRELIASGKLQPHINAFGGCDRFWLGPEGGQFSIFFPPGAAFDLEHWQTPAVLDSLPFDIVQQEAQRIAFRKEFQLQNYSGTRFEVRVDREIHLLDRGQVEDLLGIAVAPALSIVAVESLNKVTNLGKEPWTRETGALSIWILGMFNPSPATTIAIPYQPGPEAERGPAVNDDYFGKVPAERLLVKDGLILFSADGRYRSKIGLNPARATDLAGSYDAQHRVLTVIHYNQPEGVTDYVNSAWHIQDKPFAGDVINSYNDGPPAPGAKPMGPFYELETSSPAAFLKPGESIVHAHRTIHLQGSEEDLDRVARALFKVGLGELAAAFPPAEAPKLKE